MNILSFAGSNSSTSINHQLVSFVTSLADHASTEVIRLTDFDVPMYGIDLEKEAGIPAGILALNDKITNADAIFISVAEHNGNLSAFFKNIMDWLSRNNRTYLEGKKVIVLSTSPGGGGGASALALMQKSLPYLGAEVVGAMAIPSFNDSFVDGKLVDSTRVEELTTWVKSL